MYYRIVLSADGISDALGPQGAIDITEDFKRRPWHHNVKCYWEAQSHSLVLQAENDYDKDGLALVDEFSDELAACLKEIGSGEIRVVSVAEIPHLTS